ncbi:MAG TPA: hypothetical protein VJJ98_07020 [Sedimentisphaerales bacterium]|nr:hypothetical protein [Sedimentisphaerales bacterium]
MVKDKEAQMPFENMNRREFVGLTTASIAGGVLGFGNSSVGGSVAESWDPNRPFATTGKPLTVQPVLMYRVSEKRQAASWKSWGGVQSEEAASEEAQRISGELKSLTGQADFPMHMHPVVKVKSLSEAQQVHKNDYDVVLVYAATGSGYLLKACLAQEKDKDTIVFVRHESGPTYYWYEALSTKYLKTAGGDSGPNSHLDHGGLHVEDVVVDDCEELRWRLRALCGLKNFVGARIVALGGAWGKYSPEAPKVAADKYRLEIIEVGYDDVAERIRSVRADHSLEPIRITPERPIYSKAIMPLKGFRDEETKSKKQIQDFRRVMGEN